MQREKLIKIRAMILQDGHKCSFTQSIMTIFYSTFSKQNLNFSRIKGLVIFKMNFEGKVESLQKQKKVDNIFKQTEI